MGLRGYHLIRHRTDRIHRMTWTGTWAREGATVPGEDPEHRLRRELRRLHFEAGEPKLDSLVERAGSRRARSTLGDVLVGRYRLTWGTLDAFVTACAEHANARGKPLAAEMIAESRWTELYEDAYPPKRRSTRAAALWPRRVGVVPRLADCFQRRVLADELLHAVEGGGTAVLTGTTATTPTQLLSGMGGVGKTQLAAGIANHLHDAGRVDALVWISATSRQAIIAGYAQAAVDLSVSGADGRDAERDAQRFHAWLTTEASRRWLVVLDDLTSAADLKGLWPPIRPTGRTLVTTRLRGSALTGQGFLLVPVGGFTLVEAVGYLRARLNDHPDLVDDIEGLASALYHLPLALAHATAYMIDEHIPCTGYIRRLAEEHRNRLDDLAPSADDLPDDYTRTVAATVALSIRAADRTRPMGLATPLMNLASVLDPTGIPESVFITAAGRRWLGKARAATGTVIAVDPDVDTVRSGLSTLHRLNLVTRAEGTVAVHALVQRAVRDEFTDRDRIAVSAAVDIALQEVWDTSDVVGGPVISMLVRIVLGAGDEERRREVFGRLLEMTDRKTTPEDFAGAWDATYAIRDHFDDLVDLAIECLGGKRPLTEADEPSWASQIGPQPRVTQAAASTLAYCFTALRNWRAAYPDQAIPLLTQGLTWRRRVRFPTALAMYEDRRSLIALLRFARYELAKPELDPEPLATAATALSKLGKSFPDALDECVAVLTEIAKVPSLRTRRAAIDARGNLTGVEELLPPKDEGEIIADLAIEDENGPSDWVKVLDALEAASDFAKSGRLSSELIEAVRRALRHRNPVVAVAAAEFLGERDELPATMLTFSKLNARSLPHQDRGLACLPTYPWVLDNSDSGASDNVTGSGTEAK
jgi:hypothetical protein